MAEQILKVTLLLRSWRRGKGEWQTVQSTLPQRKIEHQDTVSCLVQWHTEDSFWPLRNVVATWHKSLKTATRFFCQVFPGRIMGQSMLPVALCDFFLSFFLLPLYRCLGISTFHSLSAVLLLIFTTPWSPELCLSWPSSLASAGPSSPLLRTWASACARGSEVLPGTVFSVAVPGTYYISGPSWWPSSAPSPMSLFLPYIWSGAMSCTSSLCSRFILMVLPCLRSRSLMPALPLEPCPAICLLATPGSHHPPSP